MPEPSDRGERSEVEGVGEDEGRGGRQADGRWQVPSIS